MTEQRESFIDALAKISTFDEIKNVLPSSTIQKLGEGETGVKRAVALLIGLAPFAPEPATFGRDAFDAIVAFDENSNQPMPREESQKMIEVALEAGFIKRADTPKERYMSDPQIRKLVNRLLKE